jgi:hypothetical protein
MYSGTSNSNLVQIDGNTKMHNHRSLNGFNNRNNNGDAEENNVMSMKKSAEIAAIFSGAKINQMTDIVDPDLSTDPDEYEMMISRYHKRNNPQQQFSESNMHSSLGYFP